MFKENPFMKELLLIDTFLYFNLMKNKEKVKEIQDDLIDLWKCDLENHTMEIGEIITKSKEVNTFLNNLNSLFTNNILYSLKISQIPLCWKFFYNFLPNAIYNRDI